jgi:hypothetical protein
MPLPFVFPIYSCTVLFVRLSGEVRRTEDGRSFEVLA